MDTNEIADALEEAAAFFRGQPVPVEISKWENGECTEIPNSRLIRDRLGLTRTQMARLPGTSIGGYRKWERAERHPSGAALTLLRLLEKNPETVSRMLSS